jgi:diguanylate cyclase (GGDEF)-like protein
MPVDKRRSFLELQDVMLRSLASSDSLAQSMHSLCEEVERIVPEIVVGTIWLDKQGRMRPLASPSLPQSYSSALDGMNIGPDVGTCGVAMTHGYPVFTPNIDKDPNWANIKHVVLPLGLTACWSHPIKNRNGRVLGSLVFYFRESAIREPASQQPAILLQEIAELCLRLCTLAFEHNESHGDAHRLIYFDALTGLANRTMITREFNRLLAADNRGLEYLAVLFIDLDKFKEINDTLGHAAGDQALCEAAQRLKSALKASDVVGRLGGDEFLALLQYKDVRQVQLTTQRLLHELRKPLSCLEAFGAGSMQLGASIGIALCPEDGTEIDTLMRNADSAMYRAKQTGRNQVRFFKNQTFQS